MSKRRSREEWNQVLEAYRDRSGSKEEFCREHGVNSASLTYQLERRSSKKFTAVSSVQKSSTSEVVLEFPSGLRINISN